MYRATEYNHGVFSINLPCSQEEVLRLNVLFNLTIIVALPKFGPEFTPLGSPAFL